MLLPELKVEGMPSKGLQNMGSFNLASSKHRSKSKTMSRQEISWERGSTTQGSSSVLEDKDESVSFSVKSPTGVMDADYTATYHWKRTPALSLFGKSNKRGPPSSRRSRRQRSTSVDREQLTALDEHVDNVALSSRRKSSSEETDSKVASSRRNAIRKSTSHRGFGTTSNVLVEETLATENPASHPRSFASATRTTTTANLEAAPPMRRRAARRNQYERAYSTSALLASSTTISRTGGTDSHKSSSGNSSSSSTSGHHKKGRKASKKRTPSSSSSSCQSGRVSVSSSSRSQRRKDKKVNITDAGPSVVRSKRDVASSGGRQRTTGGRKAGGAVERPSVPEDSGSSSKRVIGSGRGPGVGKRMPPRSKRKGRLMDLPKTTKPAVLLPASADTGSKTKNKVAATQSSLHNNPPYLPLHQCPTHFDFITVPVMRDESGRSTRSGSISSLSMSSLDARSISSHRSRCQFRQNYSSSKLFLKASLIKEDDRDSGNEDDNDNNYNMDMISDDLKKELVQPFLIQDTELEISNTTSPSGRSNRTGIMSELTAPTMASGHSSSALLLYTDNKKADRTQRPTMSRWHSIADIMCSEESQQRQSTAII